MNHRSGELGQTAQACAPAIAGLAALVAALAASTTSLFVGALLHALYRGGMKLNADPPPGMTGGCTGPPIFPLGRDGGVVYVEGQDPDGEIKSVAVVSKRFGSAINGKRRIHLVANLITREIVKTILFDHKTGLARLAGGSSRRWLGPVGVPIDQQELESYAKTAHGSCTGDPGR